MKQFKATPFKKYDANKLQWHLLPLDAVKAIIKVLMYGAQKYSPDNWCAGAEWSRYYDALMRHISSWWRRSEGDAETGFSHLWHAGCCILFLIAYELRGIGRDDRPQRTSYIISGEKK